MMRLGRVVCLAVLALLSAVWPAEAIVLSDAPSGFRIDANAPDARVCVIHPLAQRDPVACQGEELPAGVPVSSGITHEIATVRFIEPGWRFAMTALFSGAPGQTEMSPARADEFVVGFRGGMARNPNFHLVEVTPPGRHEQLNINGRQVLRHVVEMTPAPGQTGPDRWIVYHVVGADAVVTVSFLTWAAELPRVEPLAAAMMQTVNMNAPRSGSDDEGTGEGLSPRMIGELTGRLLGVILVVGLVIRVLRKRSPAPPPQPPMGPYGQPQGGPWQPQGGPYGQAPGNPYGQPQGGPWQPQAGQGQPQGGPYGQVPGAPYGQQPQGGPYGQAPGAPYGQPQGGPPQPQGGSYAQTEFVPMQPPPDGQGGWRPPGSGSQ